MRRWGSLAGVVVALVVAAEVVAIALMSVRLPSGPTFGNGGAAGEGLLVALVVAGPPIAFAVVGSVLVARLPRNPIGWGLAGYGLNFGGTVAAESYVALSAGGVRPPWGVELAGWFASWNWALGLVVLAMTLLHFPTGALPSSRWRWMRWVASFLALSVVVAWGATWQARHDPTLIEDTSSFPPLAEAIQSYAETGVMVLVLLSLASLFFRFRRGRDVERSQLKWLFYAVACAGTGMALFVITGSGPGRDAPPAAEALTVLGLMGIPAAIGIAVTRYRLYDIDRVVSRTLSYAIVSAVLVGVYAGGVLGFGALARAVTGESGDLVVASSTLLVAAVFQPLRHRVQALVGRRFNRASYDAQRTLDSFGRSLRDELDSTALITSLRAATGSALQPAVVSVHLVAGDRAS